MTSLIESTATKRCSKCQQVKAAGDFYVDRRRGGTRPSCKQCCLDSNKNQYNIADSKRARYVKYGLTKEQFEQLIARQEWACACCKKSVASQKDLVVDHCHKTGKVRGLLCQACNVGIGRLGDDIDGLLKARDYLIKALSNQNVFDVVRKNG
jgi:hypothetical protein